MLQLRGIDKSYGRRPILRGLDLDLPKGALLLAVGPNGAGKSTLLRVMGGLTRPDQGRRTCSAPPGGIGYLGHDTCLYPQLSALENLAFWRKLHALPAGEDILLPALDRMGLLPFADERAGCFSRGMAQRLALARLFLLAPSLALLDEPLSGLDAPSQHSLRTELAALKASGATLVWVTHAPEQALPLADALLCLHGDGRHELMTPDAFAARAPGAGSC